MAKQKKSDALADVVQANFPDGVKLPDCLRAVCDYLDAHG
jgi:hypothetical protein